MKTDKDCILCGGSDFSPVLVSNINLIKCRNCGLVCVFPLPSEDEVMSFYSIGKIEIPTSADEKNNRRFLKLIEEFRSPGRLIDIGAWYGDFLVVAKKRGWTVAGVEPNPKACEFVNSKYGIKMLNGTIKDALASFGNGSFDVVTMFHVIEHIANPIDYILDVSKILKRGEGLLVIRTPNINAILFSILGRHWGHLALPAHLYFYSPSTLKILLEKCGFKILHSSTLSCPTVNEVFELLKGFLKFIGIKRLLVSVNQERGITIKNLRLENKLEGRRPNLEMPHFCLDNGGKLIGLMSLKGVINEVTKPIFYMTYPLWYYFERKGYGSELFVIAKRKKED